MPRKTVKPSEQQPQELSEANANGEAKEEGKGKKKAKKKDKDTGSFRDLFRYADGKDYFLIFVGLLAAVATGGSIPAMSIIFGGLSNNFISTESSLSAAKSNASKSSTTAAPISTVLEDFEHKTTISAIQYAALGVFMLIAGYLQTACWLSACERQVNKIRKKFLYSILRQDKGWFDQHQTGTLTAALADNLDRIREGIGDKLGILIQNMAQCIIGVIIAFCYSWSLTLVMMSLSPFTVASNYFMAKMITTHTRKEQQKYAIAGAVAEEVLSCIRTVTAFNGQKREADRYEDALDQGRQSGVKKNIYVGIGLCVMYLTQYASFALAFWYGSKLIVDGTIDQGSVFVVFFSINMGSQALGNAGPQLATVAAAKGSAAAIYAIIDRTPEVDAYSTEGRKIAEPHGKIEFKNVHFSYPTRPELKILNGLSFSVQEGETVALVGPSGCGKSTVVNLLLRQYNPLGGEITLDGERIEELNVNWLRNCLGVVSQEPVLFENSVEENIQMGKPDVTRPEMVNACRMSNAHHFITKLPEQYNTMVGQRGAQLSGGQKQRIAIARALVREPKVLLLDEATSALDAESEFIVQQALDQAQQGRTTLVIAHRLSTIRNADKIIALEAGEIMEMGTHSELMAKKGLYHKLVMAQQMRDVDDNQEEAPEAEDQDSQLRAMRKNPMPKLLHQLSRQDSRMRARTDSISARRTSVSSDSEPEGILATLVGLTGDLDKEAVRKISRPMEKINLNFFEDPTVLERPRAESISSITSSEARVLSRRQSVLSRSTVDEEERERLVAELSEEGAAPSSFVTIVQKCRHEWVWISVGLFSAFVRGLIQPAFSFFFAAIFEAYSLKGDELKKATAFWALMLALLGVVQGVAVIGASSLFGIAGENLTKRLRMDVWRNILRQDIAYFDDTKHSVGKLCTRLASDAPNVKTAVDFRLGMVLSSVISVGAGIILAVIFGWQLALLVIAMFPLLLIGNYLRMKTAHGSAQNDNALLERAGKIATESIENSATVQYLTREVDQYEAFCQNLEAPYKAALKQAHIQAFSFAFSVAYTFFMFAACFRFGAYLVVQGKMLPTDVFRVFFAISFTGQTVGMAASYVPEYIKARLSAGLMFKMSSLKPKIDSCDESGLHPEISGKIIFSDVHFTYPTRTRAPILTGLSFEVDHGQTLALVGPSGCGKSTVVSMLERFYDPIDGHIQVDDFALQSVNVPHMRASIALVSQEPILFATSIEQNIAYGLDDVPQEKIIEAAKLANIHNFVSGLPQGYETDVGEKGTQLSGGQKQRIAIARALVRDPKILLLDEATSALDTESEKIVQEAIDRAREGRTCIVIAHRLSTIQNSDSIAVIKEGKLIEQGTHDELAAAKGFYHSLMQKQNIQTE